MRLPDTDVVREARLTGMLVDGTSLSAPATDTAEMGAAVAGMSVAPPVAVSLMLPVLVEAAAAL